MKKYIYYLSFLIVPFILSLSGCSSSNDEVDSPYKTVIEQITIVNAGIDGNTKLEGIVDEVRKRITFPRLDPSWNLTALKFEIVASQGASLAKDTYNFEMKEGETEKTEVIKLVNETRYREYFVTIRLNVPVFGANFESAVIYDYTANTSNVYPHFSSSVTRSSDFSGQYALIISRLGGLNPHLIALDEIKKGKIENILSLNTEGVSGGTFAISAGKVFDNKVYISNMAGNGLKVYYWETPSSSPKLIYNNSNLVPAGGRYGDSMAMTLDSEGNGFIFFENNVTNKILKIQVENFVTTTDLGEISPKDSSGEAGKQFFSYTKVDGTPYYLYTGFEASLMLVDENGNLAAKVTSNSVPTRVNEARIFTFNEKRYLLGVTASRYGTDPSPTMLVYDITQGDNVVDALNYLESNNTPPLFEKSLMGSPSSAPGANCNYSIIGDKLYLYAAADNAGFMVVELDKMKLED